MAGLLGLDAQRYLTTADPVEQAINTAILTRAFRLDQERSQFAALGVAIALSKLLFGGQRG